MKNPRYCIGLLLVALVFLCVVRSSLGAKQRRHVEPPTASNSTYHVPLRPTRTIPAMPMSFWEEKLEAKRSGGGDHHYQRRTTSHPYCLYIAGYQADVRRGYVDSSGSLYIYSEVGNLLQTLDTSPLALGVDDAADLLYISTSASIDQIQIGMNMTNGGKYCTCSFSTKEVDVFDIQTLDVNQKDGSIYFGFYNEICFQPNNGSDATCWDWDVSLVPEDDVFKYLHINQDTQYLYAASSVGGWIYRFSVNISGEGDDAWLNGWWGSPGYLYDYYQDVLFTGITSKPGQTELYLSFNTFSNENITSDCVIGLVSYDGWTLYSCWVPQGEEVEWFPDPYFLYYFDDYFYTFIGNSADSDLMYVALSVDEDDVTSLVTNGDWDIMVADIASPTDLLWAHCPYLPSPSPTLRPLHSSGGSSTNATSIAVPVVLGVALLLLLVGLIVGFLLFNIYTKRRKYYAAQEFSPEEMEMGTTKFTYREIEYQDLKLGRMLGEGAFGKVYKGEYRGAVVAVKMFEALRLDQADDKVIQELRMEAQLLERLSNHPNIVKFVGAITKGNEGANFALVTEFCARGSLFDLLVKKKRKLPLITLVRMARDAASGILHLHKEHIVHRDIAARNILVGQNYEVYVSDFGLARAQQAEGQVATTKQNFGPISWMAPEALRSREYSEATDAFSFGVMLWEMVERKRPWAGMEPVQIVTAVTSNTRLKIPKDCDPVFQRLMKMCWRQNAAQRPTFQKIVETLSDYYKTLKQYQDGEADAFEASGKDSEDEAEDLADGMSYEEWQAKRVKEEVKSFIKQLITERNDDYGVVAGATAVALEELRMAYGVDEANEAAGETEQLLLKKSGNSALNLSRRNLKASEGKPTLKGINYESLNLKKMKQLKGKGKEDEAEADSKEDLSSQYMDIGEGSKGSTNLSSMYMGLDGAEAPNDNHKVIDDEEEEDESLEELVKKNNKKNNKKGGESAKSLEVADDSVYAFDLSANQGGNDTKESKKSLKKSKDKKENKKESKKSLKSQDAAAAAAAPLSSSSSAPKQQPGPPRVSTLGSTIRDPNEGFYSIIDSKQALQDSDSD